MPDENVTRQQRRQAEREAKKGPRPVTPQRAWEGAYVAPEGMHGAGLTNADALAVLVDMLGGPPERGALYRVGAVQGAEGRRVRFIGEYLGLATDQGIDSTGRAAFEETAMRWVIRNPVLAADATHGTHDDPWILWPLDLWHLSPAQPGDLEYPMAYRVEGEPEARPLGRPPVQ